MPAKGMASRAPRMPANFNPDEDRHNHDKRIEPDGPGQDEWLEHVILELLIGHEEDGDHDERRDGMKGGRDHRDDRADRRADERDEVGKSRRIWRSARQTDAHDLQSHIDQAATDDADQEVPGNVAGDGLRAIRAHSVRCVAVCAGR